MANERTLFERILDPERRAPRSSRERRELMVESVVHHLARLLNSRVGCCLTLEDYGMPDMESKAGSRKELQYELESALRATITKYEPRLKRVVVRMEEAEEDRLTPKFTVNAELNVRDDYQKDVAFTTVVEPSGKISVD